MKVKILIDNKTKSDLKAEWGLAVLIEDEGKKFLLDTGRTGSFVKNACRMGEDLSQVEYGILSHAHYDHSNGLKKFFRVNKTAPFYIRAGVAENTYHHFRLFNFFNAYAYIGIKKGWLKKYSARFKTASGDFEVTPGVWLLPHKTEGLEEKGRAAHLAVKLEGKYQPDNFYHEQSLVFDKKDGLVVFNSCSHGGADNIVKEVESTFPGKKIKAIMGGFHLFCLKDEEVLAFARRLKELGVEKIYTGHCTGDRAFELLKSVLGESVQQMFTGMCVEL